MKVRELISALANYDPDSPVFISVSVIGMTENIRVPVEELGRHNDSFQPSPRVELSGEEVLLRHELKIVKE